MTRRILKTARPNGHYVSLNQEDDWYFVIEGGSDDCDDFETEFDAFDEAEAFYFEVIKSLANTPNWTAQAAYDEANGEPCYPDEREF